MKPRLFAALGLAVCAATTLTAWAQPIVPAPLPELVPLAPAPGQTVTRVIKLKNVKPSLMAYWLDPVHNAMPESLAPFPRAPIRPAVPGQPYANPFVRNTPPKNSTPNLPTPPDAKAQSYPSNAFDLPGDIQQLVSVDPQNLLLVMGGSDEDIRRLQELVTILDQPLRQAEIEVQAVQVDRRDRAALGIALALAGAADAKNPLYFRTQIIKGSFQRRLNELVMRGDARLIAPEIRTVQTNATTYFSAQFKFPQAQSPAKTDATVTLNISSVTHNDDTSTLLIQASGEIPNRSQRWFDTPRPQLIALTDAPDDAAPAQNVTVVPLRDGETVALFDFKSSAAIVPIQPSNWGQDQTEIVFLVTARVTRRAENATAAPGK